MDSDNDDVCDPSDAFPLDATESDDTDSDGIGNNADTDDDNDGVEDSLDTFPLDPTLNLLTRILMALVITLILRTMIMMVSKILRMPSP